MAAATDVALQLGVLLLTLAIFLALHYIPKRTLTKLRTNNRAALQSNRHFIQGSHFLARAKAASTRSQSQALAKNALAEAETAIALSAKDAAAPLVLKAMALDLLGHKTSALKSLDSALSSPRVKSLEGRERGDALVRRAELKLAVNRRRRLDSAMEDLKEAAELSGEANDKAFSLLGQCYEWKGMKDEAKWAFQQALRAQPNSGSARQGLERLDS